ncbi:hypothetical protein CIK05_14260 [Bdellovibrio sp. qaytius]|nr:hypothetical protein CIK05_14260 [Bdellovibrio sp. qaytius]
MKKIFLILVLGSLVWGCASSPVVPEKTIYSDLFPQKATRTEYYKDVGLGYLNDNNYDKAVEYFKLALLHDPDNKDARYWLSVSFFKKNQNNLALIELEKLDSVDSLEYSRLKLVSDIYESADSFEKVISVNEKLFEMGHENFPLWKIYQMNLNLRRADAAMANLVSLEKNGEESYRVHLGRYEVLQRQSNFESALMELQQAEQAKPFDLMTMKKMSSLQYDLHKWQDLYVLGTKFSKYHPYDLDVSERLSQACIRIGQYDDAIAELKKQKEFFPDSVGIEFKIAHVLFLKRDFLTAEELYKELYEITKSDQSVFFISQIHLAQNNIGEASSTLESLASWSEYYPTAQVQLARLEWKNNQSDLALNRLRRAQQLRPDSLELYQEYGQYMIWSKRYVEAIALVEQGIRSYPLDDKLRILAAYVHFKMNNMRSFKKQIETAQKINPENSEIYSVLAELWYDKKKPYSELEYLASKAIELKTKNKNIKPLLAWALLQQDKMAGAVKLFEEFYDAEPNEIFFAESLADIYQRNVLTSKNKEFQQKAAALQADAKIKSEFDYFKFQSEHERLQTDSSGNRLPASLDDP